MKPVLKAVLVLVGLGIVLGGAMFLWIGSRGISAREEPGALETMMAQTMRGFAIPRRDRNMKNPVPLTADVVTEGMGHYADHCAACHGNDGSGHTEIGLGLYPKPPDMRQKATQSLSDGELFYIIENGIRLTGMPAWGDGSAESAEGSWHLVHFIRRLPTLTPEDIERMEGMNPRSPGDLQEEEEGRKFLEGGGDKPAASAPAHTHGGRK